MAKLSKNKTEQTAREAVSEQKREQPPTRYRKEQLVKSGMFPADIAQAVLRDDKEYTADEAVGEVKKYMEREVI